MCASLRLEKPNTILVTGSQGQIGSELVPELRTRFSSSRVIATDIRMPAVYDENFRLLDITDREAVRDIMAAYGITEVYHLVSVLSAAGEHDPDLAWRVNMEGLRNVLDASRDLNITRVFWPSSIAAFGPHTPRTHTHQLTIMDPNTMYGITKVAGELLCNYMFNRTGLDVRCLRYPGIISWKTPPGGGTTDFAIAMFYGALRDKRYTCFVGADTVLPMMYMPDAVRATIEFMSSPRECLQTHLGYNLAAMSFSAKELAEEIGRHVEGFECSYAPDERQRIADSWPKSIDDSCARKDWGWRPRFTLRRMIADMIKNLRHSLE